MAARRVAEHRHARRIDAPGAGVVAHQSPDTLRGLPLTKLDLRWNPLRAPPRWLDELAGRGCLVYV